MPKTTPEQKARKRIAEAEWTGDTMLDLGELDLETLPPEIGRLTNLTVLDLDRNQLSSLPPEIGKLTNLTELHLYNNQLSSLPPEIGKLTNLTMLFLSGNQLSSLPPEIGKLTNLTRLYLADNRLSSLPPEIGKLTNLTRLYLYNNQLSSLPPEIGKLTNLTLLYLYNNQLSSLPPEIGRLDKLGELEVRGNPITDPPPEVVEQGTRAILAYLRGRLVEAHPQWVSKMLIVGEGGVGKTAMLAALQGEPFDPQRDTTHGIEVVPLELPHPSEQDVAMTLNCWDFGGQEIYHATHQFFLTNRSLFVLVWNARVEYKQSKVYRWMDTIKALAPESPVLIVATHIDQRSASLPFEDLETKYPQIVGQYEISSKDGRGVDGLRNAIAQAAADLPLMGEKWPARWLDAANAIRARKPDKRITAGELRVMMDTHGVKDDARDVLARWLHELGDIVFFNRDQELKDTVLLDPQWVTRKTSDVLECEDIKQGLGIFRREHMDQVWHDLDSDMRDRFLRLMEKFDLSYRIPDDPEDKSLVVERLSLDPPAYRERWDAILKTDGCKEISMKLDLQTTRPAGIPTWFIARSHRFTTNTHWLHGALFTDTPERRHLALALAPPAERYVTLTVRGPSPQSFFALLKDGLELTLRRFPGLDIKRTIPCPGHNDQPCPHQFDYADLEAATMEDPPVLEIQCPKRFKNVPVPQLLFGIHWSTEAEVLRRIDELERRLRSGQRDILDELNNLRQLTQRQFTNLFNRDQRLAESHCPSVFSLRPVGRKRWPALDKLLGQKWELQLYCEAPGCWHPTKKGGKYEIKEPARWLNGMAPHLRRLVKVFKFVAPLAGPWLAYAAPEYEKLLKADIDFMAALVDKLPDVEKGRERPDKGLRSMEGDPSSVEGASLRGLRKLLDELDEAQHWGNLQKVLTPEGHYLWLCDHHAEEYEV